jgi:predicted nucleotide-binding protein (sugar kinase/HSP70/actin superfamily)
MQRSEDSCLPVKLLVTHAEELKDRVDHIFIPRLVSMDHSYILCPKFRGAPDIVRLALGGAVPIIDETIDLRCRKDGLLHSFLKVAEDLGASGGEAREAFQKAEQAFSAFKETWRERINLLPSRSLFDLQIPVASAGLSGREGSSCTSPSKEAGGGADSRKVPLRVALIGHPYNVFDVDINKDILTLTKRLGMEVVTSDHLSREMIEKPMSRLSKEIYWSSGREITGSLLHFLFPGGAREVDGVLFLTSFKCGIDALLQELIKRSIHLRGGSRVPFLVLSFDEHTGREGLITRLEAFADVMEGRINRSR